MQPAKGSYPKSPPDAAPRQVPGLCRGEVDFGGSGKKRGKVGGPHLSEFTTPKALGLNWECSPIQGSLPLGQAPSPQARWAASGSRSDTSCCLIPSSKNRNCKGPPERSRKHWGQVYLGPSAPPLDYGGSHTSPGWQSPGHMEVQEGPALPQRPSAVSLLVLPTPSLCFLPWYPGTPVPSVPPAPKLNPLHPLPQFVKVPSSVAPSVLFNLLLTKWHLPAPNLVVSLVGEEQAFPMKAWLRDVLRKGLVKAAQSTGEAPAVACPGHDGAPGASTQPLQPCYFPPLAPWYPGLQRPWALLHHGLPLHSQGPQAWGRPPLPRAHISA